MLRPPPLNRALTLDNRTCAYCGTPLDSENQTKEHVVGRRFVPRGSLDGEWNLILRACRTCNRLKADLEDDISAISLAGREWFNRQGTDKSDLDEIRRKASGSKSRKTGKAVIDSQEDLTFELPFGPGNTFSFSTISPPQVEHQRVYELSRLQVSAFFYVITYDEATRIGGFLPEGFYPLSPAHRPDWGNQLHRAFMKSVANWHLRWVGITASANFKSIVRCHPDLPCWAWALEWNRNYRVIGFVGSQAVTAETYATLPKGPRRNNFTF